MREVSFQDFIEFTKSSNKISIAGEEFEIGKEHKIREFAPADFKPGIFNVWSFPERGEWATHKLNAKYRENWSPYVVRNLILRYTKEGDWILDAFVGSGTTLIKAKLLNRNAIGVDVNLNSIMMCIDRLNFSYKESKSIIKLYVGDARRLNLINDETIDFICTHPPYLDVIKYSEEPDDLSNISDINKFLNEIEKVASEFYRVLKKNKLCAIMVGDIRKRKRHIPLAYKTLERFFKSGFILREDIIKIQHNMKATPLWRNRASKDGFLLLGYEHIFVLEKH